MIENKKDLKFFIKCDLGKYYSPLKYFLKKTELWIRGSESLPLLKFHYTLRTYEYYLNKKDGHLYDAILKQIWRFWFRRNQLRYEIFINPNQCGYGLRLCHPGYRYIANGSYLGNYCTVLPMVLIGARGGESGDAIIGDYVDISTGVTILAPIRIGNNVKVGAGAVVNKDVADDCVVAGVPAKVITKGCDVRDIALKRLL